MPKRRTFYSFHFGADVMRVQQIRNIGSLEDNEPVSVNDWETVKRGGDAEIKKWINKNMDGRSCVVVLIGEHTASRPWVKYEIKKAWEDGRGLLGIHIHNLKCPNEGKGKKGSSPFEGIQFKDSDGKMKTIPCKNPKADNAYNDIKENLEAWIEEAIALRA
ncbi:TIR domain-containing protein [Cupriavidus basilensis]|uniref:TIR domain-containing protein n=1 Tax=Cupriavidus basilensis TaxID=68895 RepID=UPI0039F66338